MRTYNDIWERIGCRQLLVAAAIRFHFRTMFRRKEQSAALLKVQMLAGAAAYWDDHWRTVGAATSTVNGILGIDTCPRFRNMLSESGCRPTIMKATFESGVRLPEEGVTYRQVPAEFMRSGYRYTYVNDRPSSSTQTRDR